jgi:hypothetical protein
MGGVGMIRNTYRLKVRTQTREDKYAIHIDYREKQRMWFCDILFISSIGNGKTTRAGFDHRQFVTNWICDQIVMTRTDITNFEVHDVLADRKYHAEVDNDPDRGDRFRIEVDDHVGTTLKTRSCEQLTDAINDVLYWIM